MEKGVISDYKLGILGGGQLGKMLALSASTWHLHTRVLDTSTGVPAEHFCHEFVEGDFRDEETVVRFARGLDLLTLEIEQVSTRALYRLRDEGVAIAPSPEILELIQDKGRQNQWLAENGFPKPWFKIYEKPEELVRDVKSGKLKFPFVQKSLRLGYDGRGVRVMRNESDFEQVLHVSSLVEMMVPIEREISVIVARNRKGEKVVYDPAEMIFNPAANLVDYLVHPAKLTTGQVEEAQRLALQAAEALGLEGVLAVELFLDSKGKFWVNEMSPRPHNSGHQTIENCMTSQYEQHLRAVLNFPLGSTRLKMHSVMLNLLGEPGHKGPPVYLGLRECLAVEGVQIHIYGKKLTAPYRKMGHVTVLDYDTDKALQTALWVKERLKVTS